MSGGCAVVTMGRVCGMPELHVIHQHVEPFCAYLHEYVPPPTPQPEQDAVERGVTTVPEPDGDDSRCAVFWCKRRIVLGADGWVHVEAQRLPIDPQTRERIRHRLHMFESPLNTETAAQVADRIIEEIGGTAVSLDYWQRELHSGHTLLGDGDCISRRPDDVKPGWLWCSRRPMGCLYTVPSNARCEVHGRMDACWAAGAADGGGKGTGA